MAQQHEVEELARAAASGDAEALGALYDMYADPVLRLIRTKITGDLHAAEDIAAATWEKVARAIRSYQPIGGGFPAWLATITRRTTAEYQRTLLRRWGREELRGDFLTDDVLDPSMSVQELAETRMVAATIARAVESLPPKQRTCVRLRFYVGLSVADTAAVMGMDPNAVKQTQLRAKRTLAKRLPLLGITGHHVVTLLQPRSAAAAR